MKAGEQNPAVNDLLTQAQELRDEKESLFEKVGANRDILRNYAKTGMLDKDQAAAIKEFYPPPAKKGAKPATTPAN